MISNLEFYTCSYYQLKIKEDKVLFRHAISQKISSPYPFSLKLSKRGEKKKKHEFHEMGSNTVKKRREFPGGQVFSRYRKRPVQGGAGEQWAPGGMSPRKNKKETQRISDMLFEYVEKKNYTLMKHLVKHVENQANKRCEILLKKSQKLERKYNQNTLFQTVVNVIYVLIM